MNYGVFSANEWLFPDTDPKAGEKEINLTSAGNSKACVQLLFECNENLAVRWTGDENLLPEISKLIPVTVNKNCGNGTDYDIIVPVGTPAPYATRQAPILNGVTDYNPVLYFDNDDNY